jgi:glycosyltransferase involved in cell wall biosynthesis
MHILMLAQFYAPVIGGEERHVQDLCIELVKRGHKVTVATLQIPAVPEFEVDQGVQIYRIKSTTQRAGFLYKQAERSHHPPMPDPEASWVLQQIIKREKPDIVHAHNWLYYSFLPLKLWSGLPLVVSLHDYSFICSQKRLMHFDTTLCSGPGLVKCMNCAAVHYGGLKGRVTALSQQLTNPLVRAAVDIFLPVSQATAIGNGLVEQRLPFQIIPNFISEMPGSKLENMDEYLSQLPEDGFMLFVGDLSSDKGVDVLVRAYAKVKNAPPLVLIGRRRPTTPTELPENVMILGSWPHAAVMEAYRRSGFSMLPSVCPETFGIVVIEEMSMGRPVIGSQIAGLADVINDGENGFLVPPGDADALAKAIQRLVDDPALRERLGRGALRRAQDFRASVIVPRIEAVYKEMTHVAAGAQSVNEHPGMFS